MVYMMMYMCLDFGLKDCTGLVTVYRSTCRIQSCTLLTLMKAVSSENCLKQCVVLVAVLCRGLCCGSSDSVGLPGPLSSCSSPQDTQLHLNSVDELKKGSETICTVS